MKKKSCEATTAACLSAKDKPIEMSNEPTLPGTIRCALNIDNADHLNGKEAGRGPFPALNKRIKLII